MADPGTMPRVLLDRYELRERAGVGGMGEVWFGWDRRLQRDVAIKLLLPQLSEEPAFRERFAVEARAAAALDHPNVVRVYDIDEDSGTLFIVMERLPGPSLDQRIAEEGPLSEDDVLRVGADLLAGLSAAHAESLVHRDIKPGNLIRAAGGRWKLGDFGVAKDLASTAHLTLVGVAVGTPAYLAPEQLDGRPATPTTDLWAAAVVLREALTGRRPFEGNDPIEVAHAVQTTVVPPLAEVRPDVSPPVAATLDRALSYDPRNRFPTARAMAAALEGRAADAVAIPSNVPAPPASVSAEAPPAAVAVPPVPPPVTAPPDEDSTARTIGLVAIAVGVVLVLFLLGLLLSLVALASDGEGGDTDEQPVPPPPTTAAGPDGAAGDGEPSPTTVAPDVTVIPGDPPLVTDPPTAEETPSTTEPKDPKDGNAGSDGETGTFGAPPPAPGAAPGPGDSTGPDPGLGTGSFGP